MSRIERRQIGQKRPRSRDGSPCPLMLIRVLMTLRCRIRAERKVVRMIPHFGCR
jgi:hypothetical protein